MAATACVGMPSSVPWQKGRQAGTPRMGLQAPGIARSHRETAGLLGPPALGSAWVPGPPSQGQRTLRPALLQTPKEDSWHYPGHAGQQSSRRCPGWLRGPRSSQSLKAQQPHRWPGVVAGVLVKKEGDHPPQQCAGSLQCQHGQPQGQGHLALPWAGPQGQTPSTMTAGDQGKGGWRGAGAV